MGAMANRYGPGQPPGPYRRWNVLHCLCPRRETEMGTFRNRVLEEHSFLKRTLGEVDRLRSEIVWTRHPQ
jgi:hypothetical protein